MSQLDLIAQLREARPVAPLALRERVREIGERAAPPRRRFTQRRVLLVLVAAAGAALLATVIVRANERTAGTGSAIPTAPTAVERVDMGAGVADAGVKGGFAPLTTVPSAKTGSHAPALTPTTPPPSGTRAQKYSATLTLRVPNANAVSKTTTRALQITASLGGYPQTVRVNASGKAGEAYIVVKVPRNRVQDAVRRLGALGTIVGENVSIQDLQAGVDQSSIVIARLQKQLATLRAETQTDELKVQIATISARVERLQRSQAATIRAARYATVELQVATPPGAVPAEHEGGPLHGLGVAFRWIGIGAVYALALGAPVIALVALGWLLARGARRRRETKLLSQP